MVVPRPHTIKRSAVTRALSKGATGPAPKKTSKNDGEMCSASDLGDFGMNSANSLYVLSDAHGS